MLLDILDELGVQPGAAVMIGDTTYDLEMALNARTAAVGVCSGSHGKEELLRLGPLACLDAVAELPEWLAGLREPATASHV
jgi:phosphoglycolate phosphatase